MTHNCNFRVYYEDTDSGGVVYYANYLKFAERARTEMLRAADIHQSELAKDSGILFVVRSANLEIISPARLDDMLQITSKVTELAGASVRIFQEISCNSKILATLDVLVVCINQSFKPTRINDEIRAKLLD